MVIASTETNPKHCTRTAFRNIQEPTMTHPWPPPQGSTSGLSTPTVPRKDVILPLASSTRISAPASTVFANILDTSTYLQWSSFVPKVSIHSQPSSVDRASKILHKDTLFTFHVILDQKKPDKESPTKLRITDISTPDEQSDYVPRDVLEDPQSGYESNLGKVYRVAWKGEGGYQARGLRTERFHEVIVLGENECEVRTWELMGGLIARTVKWMYGKTLQERFGDWCRELKWFCEGGRKAEGEDREANERK